MSPPSALSKSFSFKTVSYADDTQIEASFLGDSTDTALRFHHCLREVGHWMSQNCLKLNTGKTEVLFFGHDASFWQPSWWPQELGEIPNPVSKVKNLGVYFDTKLPFEGQISAIASTCFFTIKTNRKI